MKRMKWFACLLALALLAQLALPFAPTAVADALTRDTVLVLDCSGSMDGEPMQVLKGAARQFCESLLGNQDVNRVAIVAYAASVYTICDFTDSLSDLESGLNQLSANGRTNTGGALDEAGRLLESSTAKVKNIVLMSDGLPNEGSYSYTGRYVEADYDGYAYANAAYDSAVALHPDCYIYTLGFFHRIDGATRDFAIRFLHDLQNAGYYEVEEVEDLLLTFGKVAEDIKVPKITGTFRYASGAEKDYSATYYFADAYFFKDANIYNPSLATMSICLALSAFGSNESQADYQDKSRNVEDLMGQLGFEDFETNEDFRVKPSADSVAAAIAHKTITDDNGDEHTLLAVAVRGGGYEQEWASNFTIGDGMVRHQGFNEAANHVLDLIKSYVSAHPQIRGDVKLWITGYSRAAATSNLVAATLNASPTLIDGVTIDSRNLFAYCFETPAGTTEPTAGNPQRYGNIFNIINPNDLVTKVAPAAMRFRRHGVDKVLPTRENKYNAYNTFTAAMLDKFYALESLDAYRQQDPDTQAQVGSEIYLLDHFVPMRVDLSKILPGGESPLQEAENNRQSLSAFLDDFFSKLVNRYLSRSVYASRIQSGVRELCKAVFQDESKIGAVMQSVGDKVMGNIGGLLWQFIWDEYGAYETIAGYLTQSLKEQNITGFSDVQIKQAAKPLLDILLAYFANNMDDAVTLFKNIGYIPTAHYPELCLAWMMSLDPNYNLIPDEAFTQGKYRIIHINCPVDIEVRDETGLLVAEFVDDQAQEIPDSSIMALTNGRGEKLVYLPPDAEFDLSIRATDDGTVTYSVDEFDYSIGQVNRAVNYYDVPVRMGDILRALVPAYSEDYLNGTLEGATDTPYQLLDAAGNPLAPDLDLAVDDPAELMRTVNVVSENPQGGAVTGGGAYVVGEYARVSAIAQQGYTFQGWFVDGVQASGESEFRFCVKEDIELTARFARQPRNTWVIVVLIITLVLLILAGVLAIVLPRRGRNRYTSRISVYPTSQGPGGTVQVLSGDNNGQTAFVPDGQTIYVGRDPARVNLLLSDRYSHVSRVHCAISYDAAQNRYYVEDMSTNGTYLENKQRLTPNVQVRVRPNTLLVLGNESCRILLR